MSAAQSSEFERERLIREIRAAFAGVSREGGISWNEADEIDSYGTLEQQSAARARDTETDWQELADDPEWGSNWLGYSFCHLDPVGFRYYLPAAMIRTIKVGTDFGLAGHLIVPPVNDEHGLRDYQLRQLSLLDERQRRCVAMFIRFMMTADADTRDDWHAALKSNWSEDR